jgi:hypothetical protein
MKMSLTSGIFAILAATLLLQSAPANAAPAATSTVTHSDGVTIKRNSDGSIEVYDVPETTTTTTRSAARQRADSSKTNSAGTTASSTGSTQTELTPMQPTAASEDGVFAVKPVVSARKPNKTPTHRTWSHGISAL